MDAALRLPGQVNAWTMPIKGRIDMLTTGVRTPVGIKIFGDDIDTIEGLGAEAERLLGGVPGTRGIYAERTSGGYFVDIDLKRDRLARYGLVVGDVQAELMSAIGGENITLTVEGIPAGTGTEKEMMKGGDFILKNLKAIVETGRPPFGTRLMYALFGALEFVLPAKTKSENWPLR